MKIIQVSDIHVGRPGELVWGLDPAARFEACLDDVLAYHRDAAFVAITGDLAERGEVASYETLRTLLAKFPLPVHLMIGNHDDREAFQRVFPQAPRDGNGFVQFQVSARERQFLFLDTYKSPDTSAGAYCAERCAWLREELQAAARRDAAVYLFMHHPPFDIEHRLMDRIGLQEADRFAEAIGDVPIRHIFFGHAHRPISGQWRGIAFSAIPGTCHQLPLVGQSLPTVYSHEPAMYAVIHLSADRTIVHSDAFLDRKPASMAADEERGNWY
ncbi:MAG: phosphodiesterase [Pseudomonadota bacterium]|nr:phosphodiesterase [Pseudomonadota bacterium]